MLCAPFEPAMTKINEKLLDEHLAGLKQRERGARAWSLSSKAIYERRMMRRCFASIPWASRRRRTLSEKEVIDLFLHATAVGLFDINWIIICPLCSCVIESFRALRNLNSHCRCTICHVDMVAELDDMIAVTFTVSPAVRRIAYHDPNTLPVGDYNYRYRSTMEGLLPDGTPFTVLKERGTKALAYLEPGKTTSMEIAAENGLLLGYSVDGDAGFMFAVDTTLPIADRVVSIRCDGKGCHPADGTVAPGKVTFEIDNASSKRLTLVSSPYRPGGRGLRCILRHSSPASGCCQRRRSVTCSAPR